MAASSLIRARLVWSGRPFSGTVPAGLDVPRALPRGIARVARAAIIFMEEGCPMRWNIRRVVSLAAVVGGMGASFALAQGPKQDNQVKPAQAGADVAAARIAAANAERMARLLRLWEQQSGQLKTLDVKIERIDKNPAWGDDEHYTGRALLMSPDLAWLDFQKVAMKDGKPVVGRQGKPVTTPYERIICTGQEVWQYRSETKQIFIYPLERQEQKRALEEGPLPFLFNFREKAARERYRMELMSKPEEENDHYWIGITPKLVVDQDAFRTAFIKLDKQLLLPVRIFLIAPDGKSKKNFEITEIKRNEPVMAANFRGQRLDGWKVIDNREANNPAQGQPGPVAAPSRPVRQQQPAMKPGILGGLRK
jgi:TIGR03009 family protein